jgi:sulfite reductase beta subunit-like hemoprotein
VDLFTHDLGFAAIMDGERLEGWNVYVGGGLGRTHRKPETFPRLADALGFVQPLDLLAIAAGVVVVQRDNGDRTNRRHGRLKYLIADRGIEWFRAEVEAASGIRLAPARPVDWDRFDDRLGWHPQGDRRWFHGLRIMNGRVLDGDAVRLRSALRAVAEQGIGFRITPNQNLYLLDVPARSRGAIDSLLSDHGVTPADSSQGLRRLAMACPALPTCGLAIAEAERALPRVLDTLQPVFDSAGLGASTPTIRMTGCPNGCARPYVAEIGLVGDAVDRYQVWLGGDSAGTRLASVVAERVHRDDLPGLLGPLVERYAAARAPGEGFGDFVARQGIDRLEYTPRPRPVRAEAGGVVVAEAAE